MTFFVLSPPFGGAQIKKTSRSTRHINQNESAPVSFAGVLQGSPIVGAAEEEGSYVRRLLLHIITARRRVKKELKKKKKKRRGRKKENRLLKPELWSLYSSYLERKNLQGDKNKGPVL